MLIRFILFLRKYNVIKGLDTFVNDLQITYFYGKIVS